MAVALSQSSSPPLMGYQISQSFEVNLSRHFPKVSPAWKPARTDQLHWGPIPLCRFPFILFHLAKLSTAALLLIWEKCMGTQVTYPLTWRFSGQYCAKHNKMLWCCNKTLQWFNHWEFKCSSLSYLLVLIHLYSWGQFQRSFKIAGAFDGI